VKSKTGVTKTYKVKVNRKNGKKKPFTFGIYNKYTKLTYKSKKGKRTTAKHPMRIRTKVKTNSRRTTVKMIIYNKNKKKVAQKVQYIYKTKTVKFTWNGKYTKHNKLKKKAGRYASYSKGGTKYYVKFYASKKGYRTQKGHYHPFYLYK
jgi:flagellar hook assembly protein FlgD